MSDSVAFTTPYSSAIFSPHSPTFSLLTMFTLSCNVKTTRFPSGKIIPEDPKEIFLYKARTFVCKIVQTRTAHSLTSAQPPSQQNGSCKRSRESCAKQIFWEGGGWISGVDRRISPLIMAEGIPCLI